MFQAFLMALAAGVMIALIAPINTRLQSGSSLWGMLLIVHAMGLLAALLGVLFTRATLTPTNTPLYAYGGGVLGLLVVLFTVLAIGKVGVSSTLVMSIAAQLLTAALIDSFGLFGQTPRLLSSGQYLGLGLVLTGATLVFFSRGAS